MMKNMFGGELKSKKEQKNLEQILKTIVSTTKEKTKNEACLKLLEIFENTLDININFDYLLQSIDDLSECNSAQCRRIWLLIAMQIIKFRSEYRTKLFNKMMKVVFDLNIEDNALKIKTIHCASNCCMDIQGLDAGILIEFLTFECLMFEECQKENVYVMILNLLRNEQNKISAYLIEFIVDCVALICLKKFSILRELSDLSQIEEEKKSLKTIFQFFEFYFNNMKVKRNSIIKNIILIYCFFVNYEQKFCWKQMKNFLLQEGKAIFKFFLEIINSDTIFSTFSNLENYFFFENDEEFGLPSYFDKIYFFENSYKLFLSKLGDCNNTILKHRIKIINGSIFFIGMSLWGYERIESIQIPNTIIVSHFFKLASSSHRKIDQEMIQCLRRLIKKFGDSLTDEWTQIFQILQLIINREKVNMSQNLNNSNNLNTQTKNINDKNIIEILDAIKMLIISNKFFGNVTAFSNLLEEFKIFQNESLIFLKSKFKLGSFCKFIANLESLIIENLINSKSERVKNHLIEMIRLNYSYIFHKNQLQIMKKSIIENLISKHFSSLIFSFETAENLNYFSHLITEMCLLSHDIKFFEKILRSIFLLQNDLKFYQNESEKSKILLNFQKNTLINLYNKLSNSFQKEKILIINKKIYSFLNTKNDKSDISFLIVILNFFKNFIVNKDYEFFLQDDKIYKNNQLPSQIVINYHFNTIIVSKKNKKVYENLKSKKVNVYEPYIVFKHNKIFDYLINLINQDETNTFVCEEVLDLLLIHLKTTFFFKGLKLEKLLNTIIGIDEIKKYSIRKRFIDLIIEILTNSTFHLNGVNLNNTVRDSNLSTGNTLHTWNNPLNNQTANFSSQNFNSINSMNSMSYNVNFMNNSANNSNFSFTNQAAIEITDDTLKEKIINFSINSLKSFSLMMKNMIINYKKIVMNYMNLQNNLQSNSKSETRQSMSLSRDKEPSLNNINNNMNFNQNEFQNVYNSQNSSFQLNSTMNIHINNITENFIENSQTFNTVNTISQSNQNSQTNVNSVNLKMTVYYLKRIFNLIRVYFSSININDNSFVLNTKNLSGFYGYNSSWVNFNNFLNSNTNFGNQKKLYESIVNLVDILTEMRNFCFFKLSLAVTILNFILSIKDILINSGEEVIIKIIFLIMNIGFPNYETEILKHFTENFNYKFRKFEVEKIRPPEKFMKREYVNLLADTCLLYFIEKSQHGRILMNVLNSIFKNQSSTTFGSNSPVHQQLNPSSSKEGQNLNINPNSNTNAPIRLEKNSLVLMRESLFLELAKWQILSKTNRDNIKSEYRSKICQYSQIFLGKQNIIMIIPIDNKTLEILIRNPIANTNMTITSQIDSWDEMDSNNQHNFLNNLINSNDRLNPRDVIKEENIWNVRNHKEERNSTPNIKIKTRNESNDSEFDDEYGNRDSSMFRSASMLPETIDNKEEKSEEKSERDKIRRTFSPNKELYKQTIRSNFNKSNSLGTTDLTNILNKPSIKSNTLTSNIRYPNISDMSPKNDPKNLLTAHMINNSNIIFQQILNMISEQDIKFQLLENNSQLESYIKSLDNTPVYYTFNCGVIYIPNKNKITEFEIFTFEGETSQRYVKFICSLGKLLSIVDNPQIYTGGLNKTGLNGKYTIYHQDSMFQMVYHVISLIKAEASSSNNSSDPTEFTKNLSSSSNLNSQNSNDPNKPNNMDYLSQLFNIRKKLIGNDYVNIVWLENPFQDFDSSKIISGAILIYIVVYPISEFHNLIKLKYNKRSKFNIIEKVSNYFTEELCIEADGENLSNYLIKLVISLNLMINYTLQKTAFKNIEFERNNSNFTTSTGTSNRYANLHNQIHFDSNLTQRFKEIERINYRFKNSI